MLRGQILRSNFCAKPAVLDFKLTLVELLVQCRSWCSNARVVLKKKKKEHRLCKLMMIISSNVYADSDDSIYMQCRKQLRCEELIEHQLIVFSLLK